MSKFLIVTDTTSTLIPQDSEKYGIEIVPLSVLNKGDVYKRQVYITARNAGNMIINIKDSRIAIDEKLAGKIQVEV